MKKIVLSLVVMLGMFSLAGCTSTSVIEETDETKKEVEEQIKPEEKEEPVVEEYLSKEENLNGAFESLKPVIEDLMKDLDYTYEILEGDIYLTMYIDEAAMLDAVAMDTLQEYIDVMLETSEKLPEMIDDNGFESYRVKVNVSYCDSVLRQEKAYIVCRNGRVVYNRFE